MIRLDLSYWKHTYTGGLSRNHLCNQYCYSVNRLSGSKLSSNQDRFDSYPTSVILALRSLLCNDIQEVCRITNNLIIKHTHINAKSVRNLGVYL